MAHRIEVLSKVPEARAKVREAALRARGISVDSVEIRDVYTIEGDFTQEQLSAIASMLTNPISQKASINTQQSPKDFTYAVEIGFLPGVTDNIATTAEEGIEDLLRDKHDVRVYTSQVTFLSGQLSHEHALATTAALSNPVIERAQIKDRYEYQRSGGMDVIVPKVKLAAKPDINLVDILNATEHELIAIGKKGIANKDGSRNGPLALDITYMNAIKQYFSNLGRNPTDLELESIAQTWSEHCHHTIFADPIDTITGGLYREYIKRATNEIRRKKGKDDFCLSVFTDNAGGMIFDDNYLLTHKVETHNSPSALDPFGGSITGIVGVNRDAIGFGLGAKPVANIYGFCFADPKDQTQLYRGKNFTDPMLSAEMIMEGVIRGVNVGGNCSGIPTPQGFLRFDERYRGKPLVFVGTLGIIPKEVAGQPSYEKKAKPGDYVVMVGGRVGKDGIHGATFSSEAMDSGSPATAVQIGDPITQKKLSDAIVKEARDLNLYTSITDNGAGGLSCSVAEMAKESGGLRVDLDKVPLKYPGLAPWEIWISESQERMTLSVPKEKWNQFSDLMQRRGVEATVIGEFTDSGKAVVEYSGQKIMDLDMHFLHEGLPPRPMTSSYTRTIHEEPNLQKLENLTESLYALLARPNIASFSFISEQYDHEVQGGSVIKPLQGRGRVNGDATVFKPILGSKKGAVISQGITPSYSDIDTYHMAACSIDTAIRNAIVAGADLEKIALLDNFCWCSSNEPERLGQLKEAVRACYDYATAYETPFISGKDSMFNDFKGFDKDGKPANISIPPTLLISSLAVMDDVKQAVSLDTKFAGDLVYVIGSTYDELGGSEYFAMLGEQKIGREKKYIGNNVPQVDAKANANIYRAYSKARKKGLIASAKSVNEGGLAVALAKSAIGGMMGLDITLENLPGTVSSDQAALYSESQGRIVVTVNPENKDEFEKIFAGTAHKNIGQVSPDSYVTIKGLNGKNVISGSIDSMLTTYRSTFEGY